MNFSNINIKDLPVEVREELQDLELEYRSGDLTKQGYEKKCQKVISSFRNHSSSSSPIINESATNSLRTKDTLTSTNEVVKSDAAQETSSSEAFKVGMSQLSNRLSNSSISNSIKYRRGSNDISNESNAVSVARSLVPSLLADSNKENIILSIPTLDYHNTADDDDDNDVNETFYDAKEKRLDRLPDSSSNDDAFMQELQKKLAIRRNNLPAASIKAKSTITSQKESKPPKVEKENVVDLIKTHTLRGSELVEGDFMDSDDKGNFQSTSLLSFSTIAAMLRYRSHMMPKALALSLVDARGKDLSVSVTFEKLNGRAEKIAHLIKEKKSFWTGDIALLIYKSSELVDLAAALFGCFYAGLAAAVFVVPAAMDELQHLFFCIHHLQTKLVLTTDANFKLLSRDVPLTKRSEWPEGLSIWKTQDLGVYQTKKKGLEELINCNPSNIALTEVSKSDMGETKCLIVSHKSLMHQLTSWKWISHVKANDVVVTAIDPRLGFGLVSCILGSVYAGSHTLFYNIFPSNTLSSAGSLNAHDPNLSFLSFLTCVAKFKGTIGIMEYGFMRCMMHDLQLLLSNQASQGAAIKKLFPSRSSSTNLLSSLRYLSIVTMQKPNPDLIRALNEFIATGCKANFNDVVGLVTLSPEVAGGSIIAGKRARTVPGGKLAEGDWGYLETRLDGFQYRTHRFAVSSSSSSTGTSSVTNASSAPANLGFFYSNVNHMAIGPLVPSMNILVVDSDTEGIITSNGIGEFWLTGGSLGRGFLGLPSQTRHFFEARPFASTDASVPYHTRSGLLGWIEPTRKVLYLCGSLYEQTRYVRMEPLPSLIKYPHFFYGSEINDYVVSTTGHDFSSSLRVRDMELSILVTEWSSGSVGGGGGGADEAAKLKKTAHSLYQKLHETMGLDLYLLIVCPYGRLVKRRDTRTVDADLARKAFELGTLYPLYIVSDFSCCFHAPLEETVLKRLWRQHQKTLAQAPDKVTKQEIVGEFLFNYQGTMGSMYSRQNGRKNPFETVDHISSLLILRRRITPVDLTGEGPPLFLLVDNRGREIKKLTLSSLAQKIVSCVAYFESEKAVAGGLRTGDCVIVMLPHGLDVVIAIHACFYMGLVPVFILPPEQHGVGRLNDDLHILFRLCQSLSIKGIIVNQSVEDLIKTKLVQSHLKRFRSSNGDSLALPPMINIKTASHSKVSPSDELVENYRSCAPTENAASAMGRRGSTSRQSSNNSNNNNLSASDKLAMIQVAIEPDSGKFSLIEVSHGNILAQCKNFHELLIGRKASPLLSTLDPTQGPGLLLQLVQGIYSGRVTVIYTGADYYSNPLGFFELVDRYGVSNVHLSVPMLKYAISNLTLDSRSFNLSHVDLFMVHAGVGDARLDHSLFAETISLFLANQLRTSVIHTSIWHPLHPLLTCGSWLDRNGISLDLEFASLSLDCIKQASSPVSAMGISSVLDADGTVFYEGGQISGGVCILVRPIKEESSKGVNCLEEYGKIGQLWIGSSSGSMALYHPQDPDYASRKSFVDERTGIFYSKTPFLGFLYKSPLLTSPNNESLTMNTTLFLTGVQQELISTRVQWKSSVPHFYACDIEACIEASHEAIAKGCTLVFNEQKTGRTVAFVDLVNPEELYNCLPCILHAVLEQHGLLLDVVIFFAWNAAAGTGFFSSATSSMLLASAASPFISGTMVMPNIALPAYIDSIIQSQGRRSVIVASTNLTAKSRESIFQGLMAGLSAGCFANRQGGKMRTLAEAYLTSGCITNALHVFYTSRDHQQ